MYFALLLPKSAICSRKLSYVAIFSPSLLGKNIQTTRTEDSMKLKKIHCYTIVCNNAKKNDPIFIF